MPLTNEEINYVNALQESIKSEELRRMQAENRLNENIQITNNEKPNVIEYQLDLKDELERMNHILSGHVIENTSDGGTKWVEPKDDRLKILSDYGVKQIMSILYAYLSKNILLSNYDEETIYWKVRDFGIELTDLIYCRYEHFFYHPSPEDLFDKYKNKAEELGLTEDELYMECVKWSREELQSKFRHFPMLVTMIVDTVHSTFLRALGGEERESLRKQLNIHQSLNSNPMNNQQERRSINPLKPSTWK
jgi:hypothetical protein